ncbi:MAG: zinc ABC transporter permease subunit ZnuB [Magnetococcales bacterium]|nr:zinc ABC transporter permease subunit ZnuB [Magnetococcales bacterium]
MIQKKVVIMIIDDFFWRAILAGVGVAFATGPMGCFMVWRQMSYFGETMAHSALLGVALAFLFEIDLTIGVIIVTTLIALLLASMQQNRMISNDTLLGILSHSSLSIGLITISLMAWLRVDLLAYLFGDILAVTGEDLIWIYSGAVVCLTILATIWRPLLAVTVHEELAIAEGVNSKLVRVTYMLLLAFMIAVAMKIVGILLITSLLIIPAATARRFVATPEQMAIFAAFVGCLAVGIGLAGSLSFDTPSGPSIVVGATILFALSNLLKPKQNRKSCKTKL